MGASSAGGPGSTTISFFPFFMASPGAVPTSFLRTVAPSTTNACLLLIPGNVFIPLARNLSHIPSQIASSNTSFLSRSSQRLSLVMSSDVGPSPPVMNVTSLLLTAEATASIISFLSSPTIQQRLMLNPALRSMPDRRFTSVLTLSSSNSLPTQITSILHSDGTVFIDITISLVLSGSKIIEAAIWMRQSAYALWRKINSAIALLR